MNKYDILVTGVGGQGNILASDVLCAVALEAGHDVKKTDTLGMAQRGGSVISHVRIGEKVYSPLIKEGEVDILLAFEKLEGVRYATWIRPGGTVILNNHALPPLSVNLGMEHYPADSQILAVLQQRTDRIHLVNGTRSVTALGNARTLNIYMLGCLSGCLAFSTKQWKQQIAAHLPERLHKVNLEAFELGRKETSNAASA